jgi:hypothetical protein
MFWPISGSVRGPLSEVVRKLALVADDGDEVGHPSAEAASLVRLIDRAGGRLRVRAIGQDRRHRRLVRHECADIVRMLRNQRQRVRCSAATGEHINRPAELLDDPMEIIGVLVRRGRRCHVWLGAPIRPTRVVRNERAIREIPGQRAKAGGAHR